jgi:RHS repeat-associated protein
MLGQRTSLTSTVPSQGLSGALTKYYYDNLYQLTKVDYPTAVPWNGEVHSWTYDAIGNRLTNTVNATTQTYGYQKIGSNPLNWQRMLSDGVNTYSYQGTGATFTRSGPSGNFSFTWNHEVQMTGISGAETASYGYDYQGRRRSKTVGGVTTRYLYDGLNLIGELGASPADYLFGPGIDEPLAMSRGGQVSYYASDALGSVNALTNSSGAVQSTYLYDAWGQTRSQTGSLVNPFTYTARETGEAGSLFYRARYLSPTAGRFLSEDPLGNDSLGNLYDYTLNRPSYLRDPSGLRVWVCNRAARNPSVGNHAYFWDDKAHRACSMQSSSGSGGTSSNEGGPGVDSCTPLPTTPGQDYAIMRCCETTANSGMWFPWVNDCHNAAHSCLANVGLGDTVIPGGRGGSCSSCWNPTARPPGPPPIPPGWPNPPWTPVPIR